MESRTEIPQRRLALELRFAIDDARRTGRTTQVLRLVKENPQGWRANHVTHNLGPKRMRWLHALLQQEDRDGR